MCRPRRRPRSPTGSIVAARLEALERVAADAASTPVAEPPVARTGARRVVEAAADAVEPTRGRTVARPRPSPWTRRASEADRGDLAELAPVRRGRGGGGAREASHSTTGRLPPSKHFRAVPRFRPGQSLDDEIEAYERTQAAAEVPVVADAASNVATHGAGCGGRRADRAGAACLSPSRSSPPPSRNPSRSPPSRSRAPATEPEPVARAPVAAEPAPQPRVDIVPQPTWQIVAPDAPTTDARPPRRVPPASRRPTQSPRARSRSGRHARVAGAAVVAGLPFLGRPAAATGGIDVAVGGVGSRGRDARRPGGAASTQSASSRASAAGCHSPPPPGSAGAAGPARADAAAPASSSRTRTQAAP